MIGEAALAPREPFAMQKRSASETHRKKNAARLIGPLSGKSGLYRKVSKLKREGPHGIAHIPAGSIFDNTLFLPCKERSRYQTC